MPDRSSSPDQEPDLTASARLDAAREILSVIRRSRDDEAPVFEAILRHAAELCDASMAGLNILNPAGDCLTMVAHHGETLRKLEPGKTVWPLRENSIPARCVTERRLLHYPDLADTQKYRDGDPVRVLSVDTEGIRTFLVVPLKSEGKAIGNIALYRREVCPFTDDQIALIESYAELAVIAIENVRQYRELQTRLEREAATKEILSVISQSREDETPVFRAILDRAERLCNAQGSGLQLVNEARTHLLMMASKGEDHGAFPVGFTFDLSDPLAMCTAVREARVVHVEDLKDSELYRQGHPGRVALVDVEGVRTHLHVPLVKDGVAFGNITLGRKEVSPFSPDEIALVETFAAQAVIAIENVRQFREVQERLERERISAEVLHLISQSRDDEQPVFDAILERATKVCQADQASMALINEAGSHIRLVSDWGHDVASFPCGTEWPVDQPLSVSDTLRTGIPTHIHDYAQSDLYKAGDTVAVRIVDIEGIRTRLVIPLLKDGKPIGVIGLSRRTVRPFSDADIQLVETFAAQAVIAIENVRQFRALETLNAELGDRVTEQVGEIERMGRLKRFLPAAVADTVISQGSEKLLESHRALIGVLFCDIRGFTAFCETAEPEETIEVLQTYHEEMGKLISEHGAGVDHRMGDGIMVLFNDPLPCDDPAGDALRLGQAMQARMAELCRGWKRLGHRLGFGVGISLGYATVGMVGSEGRYDYTANGTAVNLAARLCDQAEDGEILLSPRAYTAVEDTCSAESHGELKLKGISAPVEVFRVVDAGSSA